MNRKGGEGEARGGEGGEGCGSAAAVHVQLAKLTTSRTSRDT